MEPRAQVNRAPPGPKVSARKRQRKHAKFQTGPPFVLPVGSRKVPQSLLRLFHFFVWNWPLAPNPVKAAEPHSLVLVSSEVTDMRPHQGCFGAQT